MSDLPVVVNVTTPTTTEPDWSRISPSQYWKVTRVQPVHQTGRRHFHQYELLLVEFTHRKPDGARIVVEAYVQHKDEMERLKAFLDAAVEIPPGVRVNVHTAEGAPWDSAIPRFR